MRKKEQEKWMKERKAREAEKEKEMKGEEKEEEEDEKGANERRIWRNEQTTRKMQKRMMRKRRWRMK